MQPFCKGAFILTVGKLLEAARSCSTFSCPHYKFLKIVDQILDSIFFFKRWGENIISQLSEHGLILFLLLLLLFTQSNLGRCCHFCAMHRFLQWKASRNVLCQPPFLFYLFIFISKGFLGNVVLIGNHVFPKTNN